MAREQITFGVRFPVPSQEIGAPAFGIVALQDLATYADPREYIQQILSYENAGWIGEPLAMAMILTACGIKEKPLCRVLQRLTELGYPDASDEFAARPELLSEVLETGRQEYATIMAPNRG